MQAKTLLPLRPATTTRSITTSPHIPVRVFLLSGHRLLRDALARALRSRANIWLVGAQESLLGFTAEIIESTCDVLLVDPVNTSALDIKFPDHFEDAFSSLRIVMIDMEAKVADVISAILSGSQTYQGLGCAEARGLTAGDGKS